jgi:hypothetical protein
MVKSTELIRIVGELQPASSVKGVSRSMLKLALSSENVTASNLNLCLKRGTCELFLVVIWGIGLVITKRGRTKEGIIGGGEGIMIQRK